MSADQSHQKALPKAAIEATLVLLGKLEAAGPGKPGADPRRQWVEYNLDRLEEPFREWAVANPVWITQQLSTRGHLLDKDPGLGGHRESCLSERGRAEANRLIEQQSGGSQRSPATRDRVLAFIGHQTRTGSDHACPIDLRETGLVWLAGTELTEKEIDDAAAELVELGLLHKPMDIEELQVVAASLTIKGKEVLEDFDGSVQEWRKQQGKAGNVIVGDQINSSLYNVNANNVNAGVKAEGDVSITDTDVSVQLPDLAALCQQIRQIAPELSLDEVDRGELEQTLERVEATASTPEEQPKRLQRWLENISNLLQSDTTGKVSGLIAQINTFIQELQPLIG